MKTSVVVLIRRASARRFQVPTTYIFVENTKNINTLGLKKASYQELCILIYIRKTRLYNFDPLKPHFYIVKLGFTGVYIIFLISAQNIDCGYSNEYPQSMF